MIKEALESLYIVQGKSMQEIATLSSCSLHKVQYWMDKFDIQRRSISDAVYQKNNPDGDPFTIVKPQNIQEAILFGIGIGLYWGEGTKANKSSVRLGNTDPALISRFIEFLEKFFGIRKLDMRFGLQIFTDLNVEEAVNFWIKSLKINRSQFMKPVITLSIRKGTYKKKSQNGVLTVYYHNKHLRDALVNMVNAS